MNFLEVALHVGNGKRGLFAKRHRSNCGKTNQQFGSGRGTKNFNAGSPTFRFYRGLVPINHLLLQIRLYKPAANGKKIYQRQGGHGIIAAK